MVKERLIFNEKIIGEIDHSRHIYVTPRNGSHVFHKFQEGFGLSSKVLDILYEKNVEIVVIILNATEVFWVYITKFDFHGKRYVNGDDEQLILPRKFWNIGSPQQMTLS